MGTPKKMKLWPDKKHFLHEKDLICLTDLHTINKHAHTSIMRGMQLQCLREKYEEIYFPAAMNNKIKTTASLLVKKYFTLDPGLSMYFKYSKLKTKQKMPQDKKNRMYHARALRFLVKYFHFLTYHYQIMKRYYC